MRNSRPMYEIADEILHLLDQTNDEGELLEGVEAKLDAVQLEFGVKFDSICGFLADLKIAHNGRKAEAKRLADGVAQLDRAMARLKLYLNEQMKKMGTTRYETTLWKAWIQKNGQASCECLVPVTELPDELVKVVREPDTQAAKDHFSRTGVVPDGFKITHGDHLRVQ